MKYLFNVLEKNAVNEIKVLTWAAIYPRGVGGNVPFCTSRKIKSTFIKTLITIKGKFGT